MNLISGNYIRYNREIHKLLESLYKKYHKVEFVHPDPLEFVLKYSDPEEQEIAGIIASSFATGRVASILKAVESVLIQFPSLKNDLLRVKREELSYLFKDFKYRFYTSASLVDFLMGIRETLFTYSSLEKCFIEGMKGYQGKERVPAGMKFLVRSIEQEAGEDRKILPDPEKRSACKRLNMFLRWMIRKDSIDPGPWKTISPDMLIIPLDTHIMQISHILGFTERKQADIKTALEVTEALKMYDPEDPVRFDFSLSRLGIHPDLSYDELYRREIVDK